MFTSRWLIALVLLLASHVAVFVASPHLQHMCAITASTEQYAPAYHEDQMVLSPKEAWLHVIVAMPTPLAEGDVQERIEWSKTFLAVQPHATWKCVQDGEFLGYSGFAFRLEAHSGNVAIAK